MGRFWVFAALAAATGRVLTDCHGRPSFTGPDTVFAAPALARRIVQVLNRAKRRTQR